MGSSVLDLCRSIFSDRVVIFESLNRPEAQNYQNASGGNGRDVKSA